MIAQLSKIRSLKVISRTSVMAFKKREQSLREIGATLEVATLLEGSVRRAGDRVRIVAQLIDAETDQHLWAETYDRQLTDIFAIQTDVALQIAAALQAELSLDERTRIREEPTARPPGLPALPPGPALLQPATPRRASRRGSSTSSRRSRPTRTTPWRTRASRWPTRSSRPARVAARSGRTRPTARPGRPSPRPWRSTAGWARRTRCWPLLKFIHDFDWAGAEAGVQAGARAEPGRRRHLRPLRLALFRARALRRGDGAGGARAGARSAGAPVGCRHRRSSGPGGTRRRCRRRCDASSSSPSTRGDAPRWGGPTSRTGRSEEGLAELEQAVTLDPENTLYLAQLGEAYGLAGKPRRPGTCCEQLEELSRAAVRLALPHGLRLHRPRRARDRDGLAGARLRGAGRQRVRHQGLVPVHAAARTSAVHRRC